MSLLQHAGQLLAKPTPSASTMALMSRVSNPSAGNILPTVIIESGVISGRSAYAWKRNGFLEFQERFLEEAGVALIWLWGVQWMGNMFDWAAKKVSIKPLDTRIGWGLNRMLLSENKQAQTLALTPLERYTASSKTAQQVLRLKGVRLAFSVLTSVGLLAWAVPVLNQKKTEWLIKRFYTPKHTPSQVSTTDQPQETTQRTLSFRQASGFRPFQAGLSHTSLNAAPNTPSPAISPAETPQTAASKRTTPLQFGGWGEKALNTAGHLIQDTDLGNLFALDTGILAGRTYNASKRSPFEAGEVLIRDLASYYFYFFAVPHIMGAAQGLGGKVFGSQIHLEPLVGEKLKAGMQAALAQWKTHATAPQSPLSTHTLKEMLLGTDQAKEAYHNLVEMLKTSLRESPTDVFLAHLDQEFQYLKHTSPSLQGRTLTEVIPALGHPSQSKGKSVSALQVQTWIEALEEKGAQTWGKHTARDLQKALKLAYQATAGMSTHTLQQTPLWQTMWQNSTPYQQAILQQRLESLAHQNTSGLLNSQIRRLLHLAESHVPIAAPALREALLSQGEGWAKHLEAAEMEGVSVLSKLPKNTQNTAAGLQQWLTQTHAALKRTPAGPLTEALTQKASHWLENPQLLSLAASTESPALTQQLEALFQGGLQRNTALLKDSMRLLGVLPESAKDFGHPAKYQALQQKIEAFLQGFLSHLEKQTGHQAKAWEETALMKAWQEYAGLSRNLRYASNIAGIGFGIWGLSYLIPRVQYAITAKLTGRNEHPGIAAVLHQKNQPEAPALGKSGPKQTGIEKTGHFQPFKATP